MNNITSEGLSLLLSTGPLSYNTDKKVTVNFSTRDLPQAAATNNRAPDNNIIASSCG